ncbi:hypothetical protein QAD02_002196 [Eretmocerus hayati]|uniref:Uncharacterized protein n=1 Tax=Eretmocerus hayati TaxID=131215 RepID=A0ACC2NIL8_9HYME|nr:hypothetical protein QAD02_002196 [Eretmocerus hayati]
MRNKWMRKLHKLQERFRALNLAARCACSFSPPTLVPKPSDNLEKTAYANIDEANHDKPDRYRNILDDTNNPKQDRFRDNSDFFDKMRSHDSLQRDLKYSAKSIENQSDVRAFITLSDLKTSLFQ